MKNCKTCNEYSCGAQGTNSVSEICGKRKSDNISPICEDAEEMRITREEAIRHIESIKPYVGRNIKDALDMATKALEQESYFDTKPKFIDQLKMEKVDTQYEAGVVCEKDGNYIIGYEMRGAENTFSIGQPVYDKDRNIMGWLGIGLFENLNYSAKIRVPCEYWQICLPTKFCEIGKRVYTYWQMTEVEPQESEELK